MKKRGQNGGLRGHYVALFEKICDHATRLEELHTVPTKIIAPLKKGYIVAPETPILTSFFHQNSWFLYINQ